jgi:type II secretory pathway pseudopilin PulG
MRKILLNKKGAENLLNTLLGILVAVICIGILVSFVVRAYFSATIPQEKKEAEASISNLISSEISRINAGGFENSSGVLIPNPDGWYVLGFTEDKKPNLCAGQNCICLCKNIIFNVYSRQEKECDKNGVCEIVPNLKSFEKIKIEKSGTFIFIKKNADLIEVSKYGN